METADAVVDDITQAKTKFNLGQKVVHKKHAFGDIVGIGDEESTLTVKLDFDQSVVTAPAIEWRSAFLIEEYVFDVENATIDELRDMLRRVQAIRVAEPGKAQKTKEVKAKAQSMASIAGLPPEVQAQLRAMNIGV